METWKLLRRLLRFPGMCLAGAFLLCGRLGWLFLLCAIAVFLGGGFLLGVAVAIFRFSEGGASMEKIMHWLLPAEFFGSLVVLALPFVSGMVAALMTTAAVYAAFLWVRDRWQPGGGTHELSDSLWVMALAIAAAWTFRLMLRQAMRRKWAW